MISVLCPTRNRPGNVQRLIDSATSTAAGAVEFVFYTDDDAPLPAHITSRADVTAVTGPRIVLSAMWNACYPHATGDIVMQCGDDIVFRSPNWDTEVAEAFNGYPDRVVFVHGDDLVYGARFGTHGFLHRTWVDTVGYVTPPWFVSDYGDTWLNDVANDLGRRVYLPGVITEHMHPAFGKADWDLTHRERLARHDEHQPGDLYDRLAPERAADAAKLRAVIGERSGV